MYSRIRRNLIKRDIKRTTILVFQKHIQKSISMFSRFFIHRKYIKKVHRNDADILPIEITSKKVHRSKINFLSIQIMSRRIHQSNIDFLPIEII